MKWLSLNLFIPYFHPVMLNTFSGVDTHQRCNLPMPIIIINLLHYLYSYSIARNTAVHLNCAHSKHVFQLKDPEVLFFTLKCGSLETLIPVFTRHSTLSISAAALFLQRFNFKLSGEVLSKMCLEYSNNYCKKWISRNGPSP